MAGIERWRSSAKNHFASWPGTVSEILADGKWIAFTGQYDGNFNVYVMPAEGGQPKQPTYYQGAAQPLSDRMGIHSEVINWLPDSKRIFFISRSDASNGWSSVL